MTDKRETFWNIVRKQLWRYEWALKTLRMLRIRYVPSRDHIAYVNSSYELILTDRWFELADSAIQSNYKDFTPGFVLLHEILHILFGHIEICKRITKLFRKYGEPNRLWRASNIAADVFVNEFLQEITGERCDGALYRDILACMLGDSSLIYVSNEEALSLRVIQHIQGIEKQMGSFIPGEDLRQDSIEGDGAGEGEVINEGDRRVYGSKNRVGEILRRLKAAGVLPGGLLRYFALMKDQPKVDWGILLRQEVLFGSRFTPRIDWRIPGRRGDYMPSTRKIFYPRVWCLIDSSGSIGPKILNIFMSELLAITKTRRYSAVYVIPWDADFYGVFEVKHLGDLSKIQIRGKGGTVIGPTLRFLLNKVGNSDIVIILTDGAIHDIREKTTRDLLWAINARARRIICVTTDRPIPYPFVKNIYIGDHLGG